jgi:hypothetical protein
MIPTCSWHNIAISSVRAQLSSGARDRGSITLTISLEMGRIIGRVTASVAKVAAGIKQNKTAENTLQDESLMN